jgi:hypothetical protein
MSALTEEVFTQLPETVQSEYVKQEDGTYQHGGFLKLKGSLNELDSKYKSTEQRLAEIEQAKQAEIEKAQQEAYEKAKKEGNVEELEQRFQQQLEDAQKRAGETEAQYKTRLEAMASREKSAIATDLSALALDDYKPAFKQLVSSRISIDLDTGKEIYLNADGSASSLDRKGFEAELMNDPVFKAMIKAKPNAEGGGNANGNTGGSAGLKVIARADFEAMNHGERAKFISSGGKVQ